MLGVIFLYGLALIWIIFASIQDLRKREVADWLNFSLIIFALGFRFFYSIFSNNSFGFFYQGLLGLGIFFILGNVLYYGRLFAGGDAKLMIALGAVLPLSGNFFVNLKVFATFIILFLFAGAIYGVVVTLNLSIRHFKVFKYDFYQRVKKNKRKFFAIMGLGVLMMVFGFIESLLFVFGVLIFVFPYLFFYAKSVDEKCMIKSVNVKDLTEGDWLYKDVKIGKETIKARWDGLSKFEIEKIKKKYSKIKIRQGIPFVPVFLIAFLILIYILNSSLWNAF